MASSLTIASMTTFPNTTFAGSEVFPLVYPGNAASGINYNITSRQLALLLSALINDPTVLEDEASYASVSTDTKILVKNSGALTTTITLLESSNYSAPILVKDIAGYASQANPVTVVFSGGESVDGLTQIDIINPYGSFLFSPIPASAGGGFYGP